MEQPEVILGTPKPEYEVADVLRRYGEEYLKKHKVSYEQKVAMNAIEKCRTSALGGHVDECDQCGVLRISYNSCRNRHCPKCGVLAKARWLEERLRELLPIEYYHVVFTIDHAINVIIGWNQERIYDLLFKSATEVLKEFGKKYLGGELGIIGVLHTWGQDMSQHVHLHCIVTGGALSLDRNKWNSCLKGLLLPVIELSKEYRDRFCKGLEKSKKRGELFFGGSCVEYEKEERFDQLLSQMRMKKWEVYAKEPFGGAEKVLDYLGRYVHRVAISNHRIISIKDSKVIFEYRDYRSGGDLKEMKLETEEFIGRFLQHILPKGFVRIRYYGLWHNRNGKEKLRRCRELLGLNPEIPPVERESYDELLENLTGVDIHQCPVCEVGRMIRKQRIEPMFQEPGGIVWRDALLLAEAA